MFSVHFVFSCWLSASLDFSCFLPLWPESSTHLFLFLSVCFGRFAAVHLYECEIQDIYRTLHARPGWRCCACRGDRVNTCCPGFLIDVLSCVFKFLPYFLIFASFFFFIPAFSLCFIWIMFSFVNVYPRVHCALCAWFPFLSVSPPVDSAFLHPLLHVSSLTHHFHLRPLCHLQDNEAAVYWSEVMRRFIISLSLLLHLLHHSPPKAAFYLDAFQKHLRKRPVKHTQQCFLHNGFLQLWKKLIHATIQMPEMCPLAEIQHRCSGKHLYMKVKTDDFQIIMTHLKSFLFHTNSAEPNTVERRAGYCRTNTVKKEHANRICSPGLKKETWNCSVNIWQHYYICVQTVVL